MDKLRSLLRLMLLITLALLIVTYSHSSSQQVAKTQAVAPPETPIAALLILQPASPPSIVATPTTAVIGSSTTNTTSPDWLITVAFGLVGVVVGALLTAYFSIRQQNRQNRRQVVYDLYAEFQSKEMLEARLKADLLLKEHKADFLLSLMKAYDQIGVENWFYVSRIFHFFEKYAVFYNEGHLDKNLAKATLHPYFIIWYEGHLKQLMSHLHEDERDVWGEWAIPIKKFLKSLNIPE
jgi:hypothetical protein